MNLVTRAVIGAGALTAVALLGGGPAQAAPPPSVVNQVQANYVAGPYSSLTSCNSARQVYVRQGGFSYVGTCYRQSNGYYYFQYR